MATKSITIDIEAYERLKSVQDENESFSQTIRRVVKPPFDVDEWLKAFRKVDLNGDAMAAVERQIRDRRKPLNRRRSQ